MSRPRARDWLWPQWRPHQRVRLAVTTRAGDFSPPPWQGFNLGMNCGDDPGRVEHARQQVQALLGCDHPPAWLEQVHGTRIITTDSDDRRADGVWTPEHSWPCVVLTADCLPVMLARADGSAVGAFHAGWRGLQAGIIQRAVETLAPDRAPLAAWLGPAICQDCYQVGQEVRRAFLEWGDDAGEAFRGDDEGRWRMSLVKLARMALVSAGVDDIAGGDHCTACENNRFYSFRREKETGRFASLIWLE